MPPTARLAGKAAAAVRAFCRRLDLRRPRAGSHRWVDSNPLAIRKLEPRLVFSASIQTLAVPSIAVEGDTVTAFAVGDNGVILSQGVQFDWSLVQDSTVIETSTDPEFTFTPLEDGQYEVILTVADNEGDDTSRAKLTVANAAPRLSDVRANSTLENAETTLTGKIADPGIEDDFELTVSWGDGSQETFLYAAGTTEFEVTHRYLDDDPTATAADPYLIELTLRDDDGGVSFDETEVVVKNVAPSNVRIVPLDTINEGDDARFRISFDDPGVADTHEIRINWGDGTPTETVSLTAGERELILTHNYVDDDPTGTPSDRKLISATIVDDDGGRGAGRAFVRVNNVAPSNVSIVPLDRIDEGSSAQFRITFDDPGIDDTHEVTINWGDGTPLETIAIAPGQRELIATHTYADDNPTGTTADRKRITATVTDDDGGRGTGLAFVEVNNVAPLNIRVIPQGQVDEGDIVKVRVLFDDPGLEDTHTYVIDWGDGTTTSNKPPLTLGDREFTAEHRYLDDNPDGTPFDFTRITVTITDDDGGEGTGSGFVKVNNVSPALLTLEATDVNGRGESVVTITFTDPGEGNLNDFNIIVDAVAGTGSTPPVTYAAGVVSTTEFAGLSLNSLTRVEGEPFEYTATLIFKPNPDPINPADDVTIRVRVADHDRGFVGGVETGVSNQLTVDVSNSGTEDNAVAIDTTPQIDLIEFPTREEITLPVTTVSSGATIVTNSEQRSASSDLSATADRYFELRIILPDGSYGKGYRLPSDAIDDLPALFRTLPDNHYQIFLVRPENNSRRLVIDVYVRNGKLIDPSDDSEGARDRPPALQTPIEVPAEASAKVPDTEVNSVVNSKAQNPLAEETPAQTATNAEMAHPLSLGLSAPAALALLAARRRTRRSDPAPLDE